ncbi:DUF4307 domain-containing protein [Sinosporangium siamense]|uniref:DUF4307 domain-containing protein n=1 Tax=Sinosporangium siamense TaxID=1367973 RepID=A0A919RGZ6_9ACTN|nr:DUF4307 domain-containing protein [Sinosporangium siamense]GII93192.1 hypothetical protein Ssi02_34230 [Sinosporangium siamense]
MVTRDAENGYQTVPVLGTPDDLPDRPARRGRFIVHAVIGVLVAVFAGGWGYVMLAAKGNPEVIDQTITFDTSRADSAGITFEVVKPSDRGAVCRIRADDVNHVEVGSREVTIPAGGGYARLSERLATSAQATSVSVHYCYLI